MSNVKLPLQEVQDPEDPHAGRERPSDARVQVTRGNLHSVFEGVDDSDLIRSLQGGSEDAFDTLFARYWKLVFAIAWKILRQRSEAEDVVQDVFLTIYLRSDRYDSTRGSVRTWIAQFAHFKALIRRRFRRAVEATNLDELKEFESGLLRFDSTESMLERAAYVEECLASLKPVQRRALELVHFDGYTLLEAATILKQSLPNTRNLYYRGIKSLRSRIVPSSTVAVQNEAGSAAKLSNVTAESFILGQVCRP